MNESLIKIATQVCQGKYSNYGKHVLKPSTDGCIEDLGPGFLVPVNIVSTEDNSIVIDGLGPPGVYIRKRDLKGFVMIYGEFVSLSILKKFARMQHKRLQYGKLIRISRLNLLKDWFDLDQDELKSFSILFNLRVRNSRDKTGKYSAFIFPSGSEIEKFI